MHIAWRLVIVGLIGAISGCGGDGKYPVTGTVMFNGELIPDDHTGYVVFTPVDPAVVPDAGPIEEGSRFSFRASAGDKKVEIFIDRPKGKTIQVMGAPEREPYIPRRYNEETELTATVAPGGPNDFRFEMESRKGDVIAGLK